MNAWGFLEWFLHVCRQSIIIDAERKKNKKDRHDTDLEMEEFARKRCEKLKKEDGKTDGSVLKKEITKIQRARVIECIQCAYFKRSLSSNSIYFIKRHNIKSHIYTVSQLYNFTMCILHSYIHVHKSHAYSITYIQNVCHAHMHTYIHSSYTVYTRLYVEKFWTIFKSLSGGSAYTRVKEKMLCFSPKLM